MTHEEIILKQAEELKKAMSNAMDQFCIGEEEKTELFYNSSFEIRYNDKLTGKTHKINLFICPEFWDLMENLVKAIPDCIEDYL